MPRNQLIEPPGGKSGTKIVATLGPATRNPDSLRAPLSRPGLTYSGLTFHARQS